jgi:hypothetical protein
MKNLAKKLVEVTKKVGKVKKSGYNKHQNYHYSTESDLIDTVRDNLLDVGVLLTTSVEEVTTTETLAIVKMKHKLIDSESGEVLEMYSQGFGNLTVGKDKAVFAAQTGAFKYMLSKNFLIASEDDPENDSFEDKKQPPKVFKKPETTTQDIKVQVTGSPPINTIVDIPPSPTLAAEIVKTSLTSKPGFSRRSNTTGTKEPNFP